ncbi:MAG: hypothetical protein JJU33_05265 [Phycisphaerales bacterium]|nr:hypothetical protein [Phycisphaerales bacterium]
MWWRAPTISTPAKDTHPPETLLSSTFLGAPTLVVLWSFIGVTAVLLVVINVFDPHPGFGLPDSAASNMVRIACAFALWAAFSIRFACTGESQQRLPPTRRMLLVSPLLVVSGPIGWIVLLMALRVWISRMRPGKLRAGLFVVLAAPCAVVTLMGMELVG